jgi:hypothetical protein
MVCILSLFPGTFVTESEQGLRIRSKLRTFREIYKYYKKSSIITWGNARARAKSKACGVTLVMTLYGTSQEPLDLQPTKQQVSDIYGMNEGGDTPTWEGVGYTSHQSTLIRMHG